LLITVRFFAIYRERTGATTMDLQIPAGATVEHVIQRIFHEFPSMTVRPDQLVVAVNAEYASFSQPLREGDEIALIPPVAGGACD